MRVLIGMILGAGLASAVAATQPTYVNRTKAWGTLLADGGLSVSEGYTQGEALRMCADAITAPEPIESIPLHGKTCLFFGSRHRPIADDCLGAFSKPPFSTGEWTRIGGQ